ncbi:MAG: VOC family protein [Pseudomonadota bacterium]
MPSLENLRKQAKQVLRWHRERYHPVAAEIGRSLPRFAHLNDNQVLNATFQLADAQELVARRFGFETWQALKAGMQDINKPDTRTPSDPVLSSTEAQLYVANMEAACGFYIGKLGFAVAFLHGDPPFYGQVRRGAALLNLRLVSEPVFVDDIRARENLLSATVTVETAAQLKQLYLTYQEAGVPFHQALRQEPWGARGFVVSDPDNNLLLFAAPAS